MSIHGNKKIIPHKSMVSVQTSVEGRDFHRENGGGGPLGWGAPGKNQPHIHLISFGYLLGMCPFKGLQQGG